MKQLLKKRLIDEGLTVTDLGNDHLDPDDDYVDFAEKVAKSVAQEPSNRGILLCGSGAGVDIVANKIDGVRSALVEDVPRSVQAREHEDANVLSLAADKLDEELAYQIIYAFLNTPFSGQPRHARRIEKIEEIEEEN